MIRSLREDRQPADNHGINGHCFNRRNNTMSNTRHDPDQWKREQLECFRQYLATFRKDSREYAFILRGIRNLEKAL